MSLVLVTVKTREMAKPPPKEQAFAMKKNIHKLAARLERGCQEGVAIEHKILEWKLAEENTQKAAQQAKASEYRL